MTAKHFEQIIVHVGQHKTGTTHIQNTMNANSDYLLSRGVYYPSVIEGETGHHGLVRQFYDPSDKALEKDFFGSPGDDELILSALETRTDARIAVLSSEGLLTNLGANIERMRALDERLCRLAKSVRYVAYLRDPVSGFPSACSQALIRSAILPRSNWAFKLSLSPLIKLRGLVGDRLDVRVYDRTAFPGGDVMDDFLTGAIGVDIRAADLAASASNSNVSLSAEGMYLVQSIAFARQLTDPRNFPVHHAEMLQWAQFLRRVGSRQNDHRSARMKPGIAELIVSASVDEMNELRKTFGVDFGLPSGGSLDREKSRPLYYQLVRNVFVVDPDCTVALGETVRNHPKCPDALRDALARVTMPAE